MFCRRKHWFFTVVKVAMWNRVQIWVSFDVSAEWVWPAEERLPAIFVASSLLILFSPQKENGLVPISHCSVSTTKIMLTRIRLPANNTMSHVHFVTGILVIFAEQKIFKLCVLLRQLYEIGPVARLWLFTEYIHLDYNLFLQDTNLQPLSFLCQFLSCLPSHVSHSFILDAGTSLRALLHLRISYKKHNFTWGYQPKYHATCTICDWYPAYICSEEKLLSNIVYLSSSMKWGLGNEDGNVMFNALDTKSAAFHEILLNFPHSQ